MFLYAAFRWPLKHKIMVTKQRVTFLIILSWILSLMPAVGRTITLYANFSTPDCYIQQGYCYILYYLRGIHQQIGFNWESSLVWLLVPAVILLAMIVVYGYIVAVINGVSIRNPGLRKKKSLVITTLCLIFSFLLSYIWHFVKHFSVVIAQGELDSNHLGINFVLKSCPACRLVLDFIFSGMTGAIMDPIIYCARMKEIKLALSKFCKLSLFRRRPSITSHSGYMRAAQNSTTDNMCEEDL